LTEFVGLLSHPFKVRADFFIVQSERYISLASGAARYLSHDQLTCRRQTTESSWRADLTNPIGPLAQWGPSDNRSIEFARRAPTERLAATDL